MACSAHYLELVTRRSRGFKNARFTVEQFSQVETRDGLIHFEHISHLFLMSDFDLSLQGHTRATTPSINPSAATTDLSRRRYRILFTASTRPLVNHFLRSLDRRTSAPHIRFSSLKAALLEAGSWRELQGRRCGSVDGRRAGPNESPSGASMSDRLTHLANPRVVPYFVRR